MPLAITAITLCCEAGAKRNFSNTLPLGYLVRSLAAGQGVVQLSSNSIQIDQSVYVDRPSVFTDIGSGRPVGTVFA